MGAREVEVYAGTGHRGAGNRVGDPARDLEVVRCIAERRRVLRVGGRGDSR